MSCDMYTFVSDGTVSEVAVIFLHLLRGVKTLRG